jgi:predicted dehydrogenase
VNKLKTAVIGTGYLGKFHAAKYASLEQAELVAVVDRDADVAAQIAAQYSTRGLTDYRELFGCVDAVSIVVPTEQHHSIARECLEHGLDVLVEKPMTVTLAEADDLIALARANGRILQVGHLERFNAAVLALQGVIKQPLFIETHRLAPFKDRGTDVDVILDIMIHDIDIILNIVGSPVTAIHAVGVPIVSPEKNDIANVRLEFESGCVANVTASRISLKEMRKTRIFQPDAYISIDFAAQQADVFKRMDDGETIDGMPQIGYEEINIEQKSDALLSEITSFLNAVETRCEPTVPGEAGRNALQVALEIVEQVEQRKKTIKL